MRILVTEIGRYLLNELCIRFHVEICTSKQPLLLLLAARIGSIQSAAPTLSVRSILTAVHAQY